MILTKLFLGIEFVHNNEGNILHQKKYIKKIMEILVMKTL